ncbi:lactate racemase domain-containing protein [Candidatus Latescibacterota bacterium]
MTRVPVPWGAWYGNERLDLTFPETWQVQVCAMRGGEDIGEAGIRRALDEPIGAPPLREVARGRTRAAILVDDLSRPTPAFRLLPHVLDELAAGGIGPDGVTIIGAVAAHRPMTRDDFIKKVGREAVERLRVINHNAYENLEFLGYSSRGVPVFVNRDLMACEVRIAMGMITPRGGMFGGGAKLLIPGACGQQTIMLNHRHVHENFREHLAEVGRMAGLGYIVNPLLNENLDVVDLVAGDPEEAFRAGCERAPKVYACDVPDHFDVGVFNAFPKDNELCQAGLALVPLNSSGKKPVGENSTIVIASASHEGLGWHSVLGPGTALRGKPQPRPHRTILFSPGVNRWDAEALFGDSVLFCKTWDQVVEVLQRHHGDGTAAAVFPAGALQLAADNI